MNTTRTEIATEVISCACKHCAAYAERKALTLPLRAEVNVSMLAKVGATAKGRHSLVQFAIQPPFGVYGDVQAKFGPWSLDTEVATHESLRAI